MNAEPEDEAASICSDLLLKAQAAAARRRSVKLCHTSEEAIGATRWFTGIHICNYSHGAACLDDSAVKAISLWAFIEHTELFPSWLLKIKRRTTLPSSRTHTLLLWLLIDVSHILLISQIDLLLWNLLPVDPSVFAFGQNDKVCVNSSSWQPASSFFFILDMLTLNASVSDQPDIFSPFSVCWHEKTSDLPQCYRNSLFVISKALVL